MHLRRRRKPFNIPVHWHKHHDEYITVVEGRITATLDGKDMIVKAGDPPLIIPRLHHLHGFHGFPGESCVFEERNLPPGDWKVLKVFDQLLVLIFGVIAKLFCDPAPKSFDKAQ
ncbi:cupin domain-containing protein [Aspergillus novofumigatus IBT 16806]|uniref:Cupin type-2 domain-containing protein n=1 Tax=Aspergillus novofumigatus (strain IBT 16806) TaxID=1392255 RepID=A0A2I1C183_ASPN1|nr:uncharacterized protein P174DRAFT_452729 [Aspergillus novofumigatus IBT 16806]PKX91394.1 hypothetical protein P174DRAFT_452729 [Aspergillus novofumigatus IBT 16806]